MTYSAKVLADSHAQGTRLTSLEVTFPRFILAEFNTHRVFSRNSASSRAIPVEQRIAQVRDNPFIPESFGKNRSGMQSSEALDPIAQFECREAWLRARDAALREAEVLVKHAAHKQHANRLIELWAWHTVVVSSTEWRNFLNLRDHGGAQPEMQITAQHMRRALVSSKPMNIARWGWHLPYVDLTNPDECTLCDVVDATRGSGPNLIPAAVIISVVRCAAVSFERQYAKRTAENIIARHDAMRDMAHWSPFEHVAKIANGEETRHHAFYRCTPQTIANVSVMDFEPAFIGNFRAPWLQYRKFFSNEAEFAG